ncbi:hypothetical protein OMP38_03065 [Cohnella ginsengisoli]|uniref:Uncharacterized protein n=1 Tax=Cohnella ginsengisoli TaxID=425004 RepID=A0A9X4KDD5_9BACL|nr:hypothetical protein [Cohnella ginsengisoli]MDG0789943.1 hypothetical protein [Cohnella ginsengisoli]
MDTKKLINRAFLKFSKLYNLVIDSSRKEQLVLIDKNNVRVLRFHYGSNLADPYFSKSIYFYALNQNGLPSRLYLRFAQRLIKTLNFTLDDQLLCYLEKRFLKNENVSPNYMDKDLRIYTHLGKSVHGNQAELRLGFNLSAYDREGMGGNGSFK